MGPARDANVIRKQWTKEKENRGLTRHGPGQMGRRNDGDHSSRPKRDAIRQSRLHSGLAWPRRLQETVLRGNRRRLRKTVCHPETKQYRWYTLRETGDRVRSPWSLLSNAEWKQSLDSWVHDGSQKLKQLSRRQNWRNQEVHVGSVIPHESWSGS